MMTRPAGQRIASMPNPCRPDRRVRGLINECTRIFADNAGSASLIYRLCYLRIGPIVDLCPVLFLFFLPKLVGQGPDMRRRVNNRKFVYLPLGRDPA
jgi:hypothetical protein